MIPAGGWRIEYTWDDGGTHSEPIVAWAITRAGRVTPLYIDGDNHVMDTIDFSATWATSEPGVAYLAANDPMRV